MEQDQHVDEAQVQWLSFVGYFQEPDHVPSNEVQPAEDWMFHFEPSFDYSNMKLDWHNVDPDPARVAQGQNVATLC